MPFLETNMNFKPLTDRVLIKRTENKTQTASGIFIPDSAQESPETGKVSPQVQVKRWKMVPLVPLKLKKARLFILENMQAQS